MSNVYGNSRCLKVLVSAYACHPEMGSEPGMGWNWVKHLSEHHELWVLTEENRFAPAVLAYLDSHPELARSIHVIGVPRQRFGEWLWAKFFYYWTYRRWHWDAYKKALELHRTVGFDLVHQLNMIGYREPGYLWRLDIPFVWAPIGGHAQMPWQFLPILGWRGALEHAVRNVLNAIQMRTSRRVSQAMERANALASAAREDQAAILSIHGKETLVINEMGALRITSQIERNAAGQSLPLRLVWCGVFVSRKALPIGLHALRRLDAFAGAVELHILGNGVCEREWKALADQLGVAGICHWHGMLPHAQAQEIMKSCDALLFTSLQEATSAVVMEAMQFGLPVLCHDACGFGAVVDASCGIKIPLKDINTSIHGFADAIRRLIEDRAELAMLSEGARQRAAALSWENKAAIMNGVYREAILNFFEGPVIATGAS